MIKGLKIDGHKIDVLTLPARENDEYYDNSNGIIDCDRVIYTENNKIYNSLVESNQTMLGIVKKTILPLLRKVYHSFSLFDNSINVAKNINKGLLKIDYYDLIISSSDPKSSHVAVSKLIEQGLKYGEWVQYWGDPLTLDITNKTILPNAYIKKVEYRLLSQANRIIYVSPFTLKEQRKLFPELAERMKFVPIPYLDEKIYVINKINEESLKLGYFGDYKYEVRNLLPFYSACKNNNFSCVIAGNSNMELSSTKDIFVLPRINQSKVEQLEKECSILICVLNKTGTQIPGKLYHYAATNKPILVILDGDHVNEIVEYLNSFDRFYTCKNNEKSIVNTIKDILIEKREYIPSPEFKPEVIARKIIG
ncbi:hypothetical protein [Planococcus sp. CAU13]|uniref:hypothetical protein n=1 Tax=Planococcus sp. CAU13 TaxID=1541197 RepID=UPI0005300941|nr:hypothetical protein [Planococcus sp. CAU13]